MPAVPRAFGPALRLVRRRPATVAAALIGGVLAPVRLVGVWGYESSLVLAPILAGLALAGATGTVARLRREPPPEPWTALTAEGIAGPLRLWGAAALGLATAYLWQKVCDPWGGLALFAAGAGGSAVVGWWTGAVAALLTRTRRRALALGFGVFAASTVVALVRLYEDPAVFAFDPFWGYFAGAIYDEHVAVGPVYLAYRAYNATALAAALLLAVLVTDPATLRPRRPPRGRRSVLLAVAALALGVRAAYLGATADARGFHATLDTLERALPRTVRTEHFVLHFAPATATHREIEALAAEHEFAYAELSRRLGVEPKGPIHSFVFPDAGAKKATMGAGRVEVAPPWRRHLYLHRRPFPPSSLFHELAHAFESALGDPVFGLSLRGGLPNMGLVEGLATAMAEPVVDGLSLHEQAAVLRRLGKLPPLARVLGPGFWSLAGRHAYTAAGAFAAYVAQTHGDDALVALYRAGGDVEAVLGAPLSEVERTFHAFLDAIPVAPEVVEAQRARFSVRSIFERPCAHRMGRLFGEVARARARGERDRAVALLETACDLEPFEPRHRLALAEELAAGGDLAAARTHYATVADDASLPPSVRAEALEGIAVAWLVDGDPARAAEALDRALALPLPAGLRRRIELARRAAAEPVLRGPILRYLRRFEHSEDGGSLLAGRIAAAGRMADLPGGRALGPYLTGRQLANVAVFDLAAGALARAEDALARDETALSPAFARALAQLRAAAALATGAFGAATAAVGQMEARMEDTAGRTVLVDRWRRRIAFHRAFRRAVRSPG